MRSLILAAIAASFSVPASAAMFITEWSYSSDTGEYVEFTNVGLTPVNMTGYTYDDISRIATPASATGGEFNSFDLSGFGIVQPGESVVITESLADDFRFFWSIPASVKILGGFTNNLGRSDEINLYNSAGTLVDRLTYNDQGAGNVDGPRTQNASAHIALANLGANNASLAVLATVGDIYGSYLEFNGVAPGSPGLYPVFVVPEPTSVAALALGGLVAMRRRRA